MTNWQYYHWWKSIMDAYLMMWNIHYWWWLSLVFIASIVAWKCLENGSNDASNCPSPTVTHCGRLCPDVSKLRHIGEHQLMRLPNERTKATLQRLSDSLRLSFRGRDAEPVAADQPAAGCWLLASPFNDKSRPGVDDRIQSSCLKNKISQPQNH